MALFEKLTEAERDMIDTSICDYVEDNCSKSHASLDYLLRIWDESKSQYLYKMLGDQLIVSKPMIFQKDKDMMTDEMDRVIYKWGSASARFMDQFRNLSWREDKIKDEKGRNQDELFSILCSNGTLVENCYNGASFSIVFPNGDVFQVNKGCKASKAIGKIAEAFGVEGFEDFRIAHSQVLNQKTLKGELCLSIHPLDYITMSDNDCGWESCMSWRECGEFRRGTVEMMNSTSVVCAYIKASEDMSIGDYKWSNKKWRELFIVSNNFILGIKGYPYWNRNIEAGVMDWLKELAEKNLGYTYCNTRYTYHSGDSFYVNEIDHDVDFSFYTGAMYNDIYSEHSVFVAPSIPEYNEFCYSGPSECMICGSTDDGFDGESMLVCQSCDDSMRCYECGDHFHEDEMYYVDGEYYCQYCYENMGRCECCGDVHTSFREVYLVDKEEKGHGAIKSVDLCEDCYYDLSHDLKDNGGIKRHESHWSYYDYITFDQIKQDPKLARYFDDTIENIEFEMEGYTDDAEPRYYRWKFE